MEDGVFALLDRIIDEGRRQGLEQKDIARKAGISPETLSRAKKASDMQLSTLMRLASAVGLKVTLAPAPPLLEKILSGEVFRED